MFRKAKKQKNITIKNDKTWCVYEVTDCEKDSCDCKLHLCINLDAFKNVLPNLMLILEEALCDDIIPAFKFLIELDPYASIDRTKRRITLLKNIIQELNEKRGTFSEGILVEYKAFFGSTPLYPDNESDRVKEVQYIKESLILNEDALTSKLRTFHFPITLYLPHHCHFGKIASLCIRLEKELKDLFIQNQHQSIADIQLLPHISFRQETINGKYISIADASYDELQKLKTAGSASDIYRGLSEAVMKTSKKNTFFLDSKNK